MKSTKILTVSLLLILIVFGSFSLLLNDDGEKRAEYNKAIKLAEDYMKRELYQLAIAEYDKAIAIEDSKKLRDLVLTAYEKRYEESEKILPAYIEAAEAAVTAFDTNEDYYIILANALRRDDDYQSAYKILCSAKEKGLNSKKINELYIDIKYAFDMKWYSYETFLPCVGGLYPVCNYGLWGYIDESGNTKTEISYVCVSRLGDEGIRVLCSEQNLLEDENEIVRGKLSFTPSAAGVYANGFITLRKENRYGYYNSLGDYKFGKYLAASSFSNKKAAVSYRNGEWYLINDKGKKINDNIYQDIKLNQDSSYIKNGVMLAKNDGKYSLYKDNGKQIGKFKCDNIDVVTNDGIIAFESEGKWGFVDTSGKVVIKPQFEKAKSFSNGLAAVCENGKWGFIDENGKFVIECQFLDADYFNSEMNCLVKVEDNCWRMLYLKVEF